MTAAVEFIVYSRQECHLCEILLEELGLLVRGRAQIVVRDVDADPAWIARYSDRVPVVCCDGAVICQYNLDRQAVLDKIGIG